MNAHAGAVIVATAALFLATDTEAAANKAQAAKLKEAFVDALKDPGAAQFRREFLSASDDERNIVSLCGEVNSKNGYGGYKGFSRFVSTGNGVIVLEVDEQGAGFPAVWATWCSRPLK